MALLRRQWILVTLLWCAVLGSAAATVYTRHHSRELFVELEQLHRERDRLDITWGKLQLEQSAISAHAQVEAYARARLNMVTPEAERIQLVTP